MNFHKRCHFDGQIKFSWIIITIVIGCSICLPVKPVDAHSNPVIDGAFTGDWCAPNFIGTFGPDTFNVLTPPACPMGTEFFWDDYDFLLYGGGSMTDTIGYAVLGSPDPEVDIDFFATTGDSLNAYFAIQMSAFPSTISVPPIIQIAIDLDGGAGGLASWFDPGGFTSPVGAAVNLLPDYLLVVDIANGAVWVMESTSAPGAWTNLGPFPVAWSTVTGVSIIEFFVPWGVFTPGPAFGPGIPCFMTLMSTHAALAGAPDFPGFPEEDVVTENGSGMTTGPYSCAPGPGSTGCELGDGSADAFFSITYPTLSTPTPAIPDGDYGDAPEGAIAYPSLSVIGMFPSCMNVPLSGYIHHQFGLMYLGPAWDPEAEGNAGFCPVFAPANYNADECFGDGDAGLLFPGSYTISGSSVVPCTGSPGTSLGEVCKTATWGSDIDVTITNNMALPGYLNVLIDWNQDGVWSGSSTCPGPVTVPEHVLTDAVIPPGFSGPLSSIFTPTFNIGPLTGYVWTRITISNFAVGPNWNGNALFENGETEDYLLYISPVSTPTPLPTSTGLPTQTPNPIPATGPFGTGILVVLISLSLAFLVKRSNT
jgi:GEVED domain